MAILDDIREAVTEAFSDSDSPFQPATRTRQAQGGAYGGTPGALDVQDCLAFIDTYSAFTRGALGIPDTDVKAMILQDNADVQVGDVLTLRGKAYRIINIEQDPAQATWTAQARPV